MTPAEVVQVAPRVPEKSSSTMGLPPKSTSKLGSFPKDGRLWLFAALAIAVLVFCYARGYIGAMPLSKFSSDAAKTPCWFAGTWHSASITLSFDGRDRSRGISEIVTPGKRNNQLLLNIQCVGNMLLFNVTDNQPVAGFGFGIPRQYVLLLDETTGDRASLYRLQAGTTYSLYRQVSRGNECAAFPVVPANEHRLIAVLRKQ